MYISLRQRWEYSEDLTYHVVKRPNGGAIRYPTIKIKPPTMVIGDLTSQCFIKYE